MKYALIIHERPEELAKRTNAQAPAYWAAWTAFSDAVQKAGVMAGGAGLEAPHTATTLTLHPAGAQIHDGPYADTKEQLGGFFIVDVPDLDAAIQWASRIPSPGGKVEVRPLLTMPG